MTSNLYLELYSISSWLDRASAPLRKELKIKNSHISLSIYIIGSGIKIYSVRVADSIVYCFAEDYCIQQVATILEQIMSLRDTVYLEAYLYALSTYVDVMIISDATFKYKSSFSSNLIVRISGISNICKGQLNPHSHLLNSLCKLEDRLTNFTKGITMESFKDNHITIKREPRYINPITMNVHDQIAKMSTSGDHQSLRILTHEVIATRNILASEYIGYEAFIWQRIEKNPSILKDSYQKSGLSEVTKLFCCAITCSHRLMQILCIDYFDTIHTHADKQDKKSKEDYKRHLCLDVRENLPLYQQHIYASYMPYILQLFSERLKPSVLGKFLGSKISISDCIFSSLLK
jgi:uncharacterized protein with HEPN domain